MAFAMQRKTGLLPGRRPVVLLALEYIEPGYVWIDIMGT